jgi:cytochrome c5
MKTFAAIGPARCRARNTLAAAVLLGLLAAWPAALGAQNAPLENPMRDMMRRMMRGVVPPPGMTPQALPAADSAGARLMAGYCTQCHDLPSPRYKTAAQWPEVLERMLGHMEHMAGGGMMGGPPIRAPSLDELNALLTYTQAHAMRQALPEELASATPAERIAFAQVCTQCHVLPSPAQHDAAEWPAVVARMQGNMALMGRPPMTALQQAFILRLLQAHARAEPH